VYRRTVNGEVLDFGTTGLLRHSNLVMYDRQTQSWWQEFSGEAIVGELSGARLKVLPNSIVSWEDFKKAHPDGKVLSRDTGHIRSYGYNPYYLYDSDENPFLYNGPKDARLSALERVAAVLIGDDAIAVPFSLLESEPVVQLDLGEEQLVFLFKQGTASALDSQAIEDGRDVGAVGVFSRVLDDRELSFRLEGDRFVDNETGSAWSILGAAESGELVGKGLTPVAHRSQFWFSWVVYQPETLIYQGEGNIVGGPQ
jgi:hypothetical protein